MADGGGGTEQTEGDVLDRKVTDALDEFQRMFLSDRSEAGGARCLVIELLEHLNGQRKVSLFQQPLGRTLLVRFFRSGAGRVYQDVRIDKAHGTYPRLRSSSSEAAA